MHPNDFFKRNVPARDKQQGFLAALDFVAPFDPQNPERKTYIQKVLTVSTNPQFEHGLWVGDVTGEKGRKDRVIALCFEESTDKLILNKTNQNRLFDVLGHIENMPGKKVLIGVEETDSRNGIVKALRVQARNVHAEWAQLMASPTVEALKELVSRNPEYRQWFGADIKALYATFVAIEQQVKSEQPPTTEQPPATEQPETTEPPVQVDAETGEVVEEPADTAEEKAEKKRKK